MIVDKIFYVDTDMAKAQIKKERCNAIHYR